MRAGYAIAAAALIFAAGTIAGYYLPHRVEESMSTAKIGYFHQCVAPLRLPKYTRALTWDPAAKDRAFDVLAIVDDCANHSGIGAVSPGEVECASGYSVMPFVAYQRLPAKEQNAPVIRRILRTRERLISASYCATSSPR